MFTGLVDDVGEIEHVRDSEAGREFAVRCRYDDLQSGESVALNGACLTVREAKPGWFTVAAIDTTLSRTLMADWVPGTRVNLERAVRAGDRLGGHLVLGHVDGTAIVQGVRRDGTAFLVDLGAPAEFAPLLVPHGSVAVDGVSLTVNAIGRDGAFQVALVEYTERHTTLGALRAGSRVHLEGDVIGKFVRQLLTPWLGGLEPHPD